MGVDPSPCGGATLLEKLCFDASLELRAGEEDSWNEFPRGDNLVS